MASSFYIIKIFYNNKMSITKEQFSKLVGGYGFETFEDGALDIFNNSAKDLVEQSLGVSQTGGRVSMPSEYFGVELNHYTSNSSGTNPAMNLPNDALVRPELAESFPHVGGSSQITDTIFEKVLKDVRQSGGGNKRVKKEHKQQAKHIFRRSIDRVFNEVRKVASKTKLLKAFQMQRALKKH
jgi:hypothetical protein